MYNKDTSGNLEEDAFYKFLNTITAFIWAYAITNPGVNSLRTPIFAEMINIVNGKEVKFEEFKFDKDRFCSIFSNYVFSNNRAITKSMITWWAFTFKGQSLLSLETTFDIEHIYPRGRQQKEGGLTTQKSIELLGNKALLERRINIRASDYRFVDKKKYYDGFTTSKGEKKGTNIQELLLLSSQESDFTEDNIMKRDHDILDGFLMYLTTNNLVL